MRQKTGRVINCHECGTPKYFPACNITEHNYCSKACSVIGLHSDKYWTAERRKKIGDALRKQTTLVCEACQREFDVHPYMANIRRYCSQSCFYSVNKSEGHYNWNGGSSSLAESIKSTGPYRRWRTRIFVRDRYTCTICHKSKSGKLEADHIIPRSFLMKLHGIRSVNDALRCKAFWDVKNGRTLCVDCHKKTDTYGWKMIKWRREGTELGCEIPDPDKNWDLEETTSTAQLTLGAKRYNVNCGQVRGGLNVSG